MSEISELSVTQVRIFPVDVLPFSLITTKSCTEKVKEALGVTAIEYKPIIGREAIVFMKGEYKKNGKLLVVRRIEVDPRRIIVEIEGTSEDSDAVYESFLESVASVSGLPVEELKKPLLKVETTQCVAKLDFEFDAMFNSSFINFLNRKVEKNVSSTFAKASVRPIAMLSEISYEIIDKTLPDNKITLNPKQFTVALHPGVPRAEKKYIISSPLGSKEHITLINELNRVLKKGTPSK